MAFWTQELPHQNQRWHNFLINQMHPVLRDECHTYLLLNPKKPTWLSPSINRGLKLALWYLAKSHALFGELDTANSYLEQLFRYWPHYPDGRYLAADIDRMAGNKQQAWQHLETLYPHTRRRKTWLYFAQLVDNPDDWKRLRVLSRHARRLRVISKYHPELNEHLSKGAQRAGDYSRAIKLWRQNLEKVVSSQSRTGLIQKTAETKRFTRAKAEQALMDIKQALDRAGIEFFLISGTLLGLVREGKLLEHDQDIDIGLWEEVDPVALKKALLAHGCFHLLPEDYPGCLRAKHLQGIAIDLFTHYRTPRSYWHGGGKVRWHNQPFSLQQMNILNQMFNVPASAEIYLQENYGDWQQEKKGFDSTLDTPNAEILIPEALTLHAYKRLYTALKQGSQDQVERYRQVLIQQGEPL